MNRAIALLLLMLSAATDAALASTAGKARYAVRLSDENVVDDPALVAKTLAATYGLQVEAAESGVFTVTASPSRARLLSADHRVASVEQLSESTAAPPRAIGTDGIPYQWKSGYRYDGAGNVIEIDRYAPDGSSVARTDHYVYDGVNRLVEATADTSTSANRVNYSYDRFGNITSHTTVVAGTQAKFDYGVDAATNQLDGACPPSSACYTAGYDDAGNVTTRSATTYRWDALGMMTELETLTRREFYLYDASNERVAVVSLPAGSNQPVQYLYTLRGLDNKVVRELVHKVGGDTWQWQKDYVYRDGSLLASVTPKPGGGEQRLHYHLDHLGTPAMITDDTGLRVALHTLWPFGAPAPGSTVDDERMKFTGHERDFGGPNGIDLDYMHARYYEPGVGRFLSVDPASDSVWLQVPQSWNRYSYAMNNPLGYTDPTGLKPCKMILPDGTETEGECIDVEADADPVKEVPDQMEAQIAGIQSGQDMARYYVATTVDGMIPAPLKGAGSYFRGIYRGVNLIADASGVRGDCKQERLESEAFLAFLAVYLGNKPMMAHIAKEAVGRNTGYIAGRVATGAGVTFLLGRVAGSAGARAGLGLAALAVAGDASHALGEIADDTFGDPCVARGF